jgi:hypothetical protein
MDVDAKKKIALGETGATFAEAWFKMLGFVAVTGVFHAAAEKTGMPGFIILKWCCYVFMCLWLQYKVDSAIWFLFPSTNPANEGAKRWHFEIALLASFVIGFNVYMNLAAAIQLLLTTNSAA